LHRVTGLLSFWLLGAVATIVPLAGQVPTQPPAAAQAAAPATPPPATVGNISVRFVGTANVSEQVVRANMQVETGLALDETMLDRDIRTLMRTGLFEFVEYFIGDLQPGNVRDLVWEVTPKYRVTEIRFEGNERVRTGRLEDEMRSRVGLALDERQIQEDAERMTEYYEKAGYSQVLVEYAIERDRTTGNATIIFQVREGPRTRISSIRFTGNENIGTRTLRRAMTTKRWWILSPITGSGRYKDFVFEDDLAKIRDLYRQEGFLDVELSLDQVQFDNSRGERLIITVPVNEGRQYRIGEVTITGNTIYPTELLTRLIRQRSGAVYRPARIDEDAVTLQDFYGRDGYLDPDTRVDLNRRPNLETGNIDLEYVITEGGRFTVESIDVEGNTLTKNIVILRELTLGPGDTFSQVSMRISKLRLENTRFFDSVELTPEPTNLPGRRNLKISVREGRTGNLQFGAGFSSLERGTLFVEFSQGNFDLFNRRSFFRGDGQKFRMRIQAGSESSEALVSFEEPWLFEQRLGLGFTVYRTSANYTNSFYQEVRTGFNVFLRKTLNERRAIDGRIDYTYETVSIEDVANNASAFILGLDRESSVSRVGFQLLRDTRDRVINTTSGTRFQLDTRIAGGFLGGDVDYYSVEYRGGQWFPVFARQAQVLSLLGRVGIIENFGNSDEVPYYDRFFLGGPNDLRGFEYREVGPRDQFGDPIGGKSYGMFSAEYSFDIVAPIRFAFYYDGGFVNVDAFDFNPGGFNDNVGISLRLFVAGSPVSLDYGIALTRDRSNRQGASQFNFSLGGRY
jgi:outer membrane protein insertion porin family